VQTPAAPSLISPSLYTRLITAIDTDTELSATSDNYFYEAYPQVFHDAMAPVFRALRVNLTTRNHALGNNPCYAYDACIPTHLGDDLDILTWEQVRWLICCS
jgi:hypothetical protein